MKFKYEILIYSVLAIGLIAVVSVAAVRTGMIESYFIYFPERDVQADPSQFGLTYEDISFVASDGVELHGWFVPGRSSLTLLWFHGNAGNISHRLNNLRLLHNELEVNVFIFDYRGYGRSQGEPSEQGTYLDAEAALDYLGSRKDVSLEHLVYFGRSLGAAVAVEMGIRYPPYALILESAYTSVPNMARRVYPFFPIWPFLQTQYNSLAKISKVNAPVLILHGNEDDIVPIEEGEQLFDAAKDPKQFYIIHGAEHNNTYQVGGQAYLDNLRLFLDRLEK